MSNARSPSQNQKPKPKPKERTLKTLTFNKPHNLAQVQDELVTAFPEWRQLREDGLYEALHRVEGDGTVLRLTVPDETNDAAIERVVANHTPQPAESLPSLTTEDEALLIAFFHSTEEPTVQLLADRFRRALKVLFNRGIISQ